MTFLHWLRIQNYDLTRKSSCMKTQETYSRAVSCPWMSCPGGERERNTPVLFLALMVGGDTPVLVLASGGGGFSCPGSGQIELYPCSRAWLGHPPLSLGKDLGPETSEQGYLIPLEIKRWKIMKDIHNNWHFAYHFEKLFTGVKVNNNTLVTLYFGS